MATFKDACFHYRRITRLNRELLKIGANSVWTPTYSNKIKGWCIECCQYTELTFCHGCSLMHVCQWCIQNKRCFLDNTPHLLKLRTFESPITKKKLQCVIDMYNSIFPINCNVINKFKKMINQRKCRNELNDVWYNQLLLPITLNAAVFKFQSKEIYVFGFYEGNGSCINLPYRFVNCTDIYDKLLLDQVNFERMCDLPNNLQSMYATKYFKMSRLPSMKMKQVYYSDFTKQNLLRRYGINTRLILRNVTETNWNSEIEMHKDLVNNKNKILMALSDSRIKQFETHELNLGRIKADIFELGHHCKPNYISSNHWQSASQVVQCKWCNVKYMFKNMDWRMESMYNEIMSFLQSCYKSNVNVGHCSSVENIYSLVRNLFWLSITKHVDEIIEKLFNAMYPIDREEKKLISFHYQMDFSLYIHIKTLLNTESLPFFLTLQQFSNVIKGIIDHWCNISELSLLPLCTEQTNTLIELKEQNRLCEEYELLISDSE
ncbi:NSP1, partial [Rotavirus A]